MAWLVIWAYHHTGIGFTYYVCELRSDTILIEMMREQSYLTPLLQSMVYDLLLIVKFTKVVGMRSIIIPDNKSVCFHKLTELCPPCLECSWSRVQELVFATVLIKIGIISRHDL